MYRRLLKFLRPHAGRMAGTIASNILVAVLDGFSLALLTALLTALFPGTRPGGAGTPHAAQSTVEAWLDEKLVGGLFGLTLAPHLGTAWILYPLGVTAGWLFYLGSHAVQQRPLGAAADGGRAGAEEDVDLTGLLVHRDARRPA